MEIPGCSPSARAALEGREIPPMPPLAERCDTAVRQFELSAANKGEKIACLEARRHYAWYLKGVPHAGYYKEKIVRITSLEDVYRVTRGIKRDLGGRADSRRGGAVRRSSRRGLCSSRTGPRRVSRTGGEGAA